ncbi:hypothetical protein ATE84_3745 [Aquimarina sp. MAR_2010_214]|uniref:hypothetical protein n=1 Tax=Aquimarina sp. MAR_2010_214 TaxID=1250026 RepID=UPI000C713150|nr:hypothetical protein [Aquimarina sp. MAR_2010_214]PKV51655.1 hypothetical protein ATE84_3745 [Aquimarina sp. MAR_2010_214]
MKKRTHIIFLAIFLTFLSCAKNKKDEKNEFPKNEISKTWNNFLNALDSNRKKDFKELSGKKIRCYLCLENTLAEQKEIEVLKNNDSLWYDKIYDELIYIPIDSFLKKDFDLIFNPEFVNALKEKKTIFHKRIIDGIEYYEVLVTTTEPTLDHEGGQHNFQFKKINGKWKLNGIETIP